MGVIGDPIAQAKTPEAILPHFDRLGTDMVCIPLHVAANSLEKAWRGFEVTRNLVGLGITLPYKQAAAGLCDTLDPVAERVGAVNVVRRERDGSFRGYQFDGRGFCSGLLQAGHDLEGRDCLMIGAGGAAMAVACALMEHGVNSLTIANRTPAKAAEVAELANRVTGRRAAKAGPATPAAGQIVINATSLGMNADDPLPLDLGTIDDSMLVAELVAEPERTRLMIAARDRGAAIHSGMHMIRAQVGLIAEHLAEIHG
ncbi:shikimate dehydrogenase family protein [Pseudohoeflea coraliihabitans]|nr:shikimate dehydrogenase [Pseudohoeflea sp. DP4N28-3]